MLFLDKYTLICTLYGSLVLFIVVKSVLQIKTVVHKLLTIEIVVLNLKLTVDKPKLSTVKLCLVLLLMWHAIYLTLKYHLSS